MYTRNSFSFSPGADSDVVEHALCQGCGLCVMVCPSNALQQDTLTRYTQKAPTYNADLCLHCGRCAAVCQSGTLHQNRFATLVHKVQNQRIHTVVFFCSNLPTHMPTAMKQDDVPDTMPLALAQMTPRCNTITLPEGVLFEPVRCANRVGARLIDRLVRAGLQRVLIFAGPPHLCHYHEGLSLVAAQCAGLSSFYEAYGIAASIHVEQSLPKNMQEVEDVVARFVAA